MEISEVCRINKDSVDVDLLVSPRSSRSGIEGIDPWRKRLIIRVRAPPLDGRANKEVEEILHEVTDCKVQVTAGHTSRQKTATVYGNPEDICTKLAGPI